jgi:accessory colonization factor AcfC
MTSHISHRWLLAGLAALAFSVHGQTTLKVYGPGGPAPAMKEAATAFEKETGIKVEVTAGPTPQWIDKARQDADLIYSGSETMMSDFVQALQGRVAEADVQPLYLRPLAILVRPGNPKKVRGVRDLLQPGVKILVVNGAGQTGVWEDMAGRQGDIESVRAVRRNIAAVAKNSAEAKQTWSDRPDIDVWLIWNIWQVANPSLADVVPVEREYAIYRDTAAVLTEQGKAGTAGPKFLEFLSSSKGAAIFRRWGWIG